MNRVFYRLHWLYRKVFRGLDSDPFFSTAFAISALIGFFCNFIISVIYYYSGWEILMFKPTSTGPFLLIVLAISLKYFYNQKKVLKKEAERYNEPMQSLDWIIVAGLLSILVLGFLSFELYRLRYLGYY